jgi:bifunctional non-homologous end joining protein LigD
MGFRCMICTHGRFLARSRRGWNMAGLLPELARTLPPALQLDGELVACGPDGRPDFHRLSARMLHGDSSVALTYYVFDVLAVEGLATTMQPYSQRRALVEQLDLDGLPGVRVIDTFEDGPGLFEAILAHGLEGVVAKRQRDPYRPGERVWVKTKNRATPRFAEESRIDERRAQRHR